MKKLNTLTKNANVLKLAKAIVILGTIAFAVVHICISWSEIGNRV